MFYLLHNLAYGASVLIRTKECLLIRKSARNGRANRRSGTRGRCAETAVNLQQSVVCSHSRIQYNCYCSTVVAPPLRWVMTGFNAICSLMADAHAHISLMSFSAPGDGRPVFPGTQFGVHLAVRRARGETGRVRPRRGAERHDRRTPWKNNSRNFAAAAPPSGRRPQRDSDRCRKRYCHYARWRHATVRAARKTGARSDRPRYQQHYRLICLANPNLHLNIWPWLSVCGYEMTYALAKNQCHSWSIQGIEWKQTEGRTRPIALPSQLTRSGIMVGDSG